MNIPILSQELRAFCQQWQIQELALFGSVLREDFSPESDIDVLVTFAPDAQWTLLDIAEMRDELSHLFGRSIDLVERRAVERSQNVIRRKAILGTAEVIYAA
ncbi:MAG: nucleotidyltransferase domain-containing protein [Anaerolineae bacterium]|nr:nucleotidyltransferase domain-containing protein [Anaerolineae bacterium]